ncbi:MAG: hypothetical protein ABJA84_00020 [Polaromonas sp.]
MTLIGRKTDQVEAALDLGRADQATASAVVLIDPATGLAYAASGGSGGGADRELVVTTYFAKNAFTGASVGDTITATQVIDVSGAPSTVSTIWRNQTTAADLAGAPSAANLTLLGAQALTDSQLRAAAVPISAASLPLPTGAALEAGGNLADIAGKIPTLISGRTPVDGSGVTQPVSGPVTDAQLRAAPVPIAGTAATGTAPTAAPLSVSGVDGAGNKQHLKTDTGGNQGIYGAAVRATVTATIANAASVSDVIDLSTTALLGFIAPAAWTAAALNIEVSPDNTTWAPAVLGADNTAVSSWPGVTAGNAYAVDTTAMLPFRYVRFRSGTSAAPVVQAAARAFVVITRPLA